MKIQITKEQLATIWKAVLIVAVLLGALDAGTAADLGVF